MVKQLKSVDRFELYRMKCAVCPKNIRLGGRCIGEVNGCARFPRLPDGFQPPPEEWKK